MNPYTPLPLYSQSLISRVTSGTGGEPHVYEVAFTALRSMMESGKSQSILITGESGSGKTEAAKQCLRLLAEAAGSELAVEEKLLLATPLLEALGNAKTVRNENSSRVGKWTEVEFGGNGRIIGAKIRNFLLEKTRVVRQDQGERNFRIFYQMMAHKEELPELGLDAASQWRYLNPVSLLTDHEYDNYTEVLQAAASLHTNWSQILSTLSVILHLGNLQFQPTDSGCTIIPSVHLVTICRLLGVTEPDLTQTLCHKTLFLAKETIHKGHNVAQAQETADNLSKALYVSVFLEVLEGINGQLVAGSEGTAVIGVLDIYGFEIFARNSFEQFCINYANEKMQQYFVQCLFKEEEDVYETEGISYDSVSYADNLPILSLIEGGQSSLLYIINDEITLQRHSDDSLLRRFYTDNHENPAFKGDFRGTNSTQFLIQHYSGEVVYDITGFMMKSKDQLSEDILTLLRKSSISTHLHQSKKSIGIQFKEELDGLLTELNHFSPQFIRCIKPNSQYTALGFEGSLVLQQLRCLGLLEAGKILQMGFPFKLEHREFVWKYKVIALNLRAANPKLLCKRIIDSLETTENEYRIGKTLVLYSFKLNKMLEKRRFAAIESVVVRIQKEYRKYKAVKLRKTLKLAIPELKSGLKSSNIEEIREILLKFGHLPCELAAYGELKRRLKTLEGEKRIDTDFERVLGREDSPENKVKELETLIEQGKQMTYQSVYLVQASEVYTLGTEIHSARLTLQRLLSNNDLGWELQSALSTYQSKGLASYLGDLFPLAQTTLQKDQQESGLRQFLLDILETGAVRQFPVNEECKLALGQLKAALDKAHPPFLRGGTEEIVEAAKVVYELRRCVMAEDWKGTESLIKDASKHSLLRTLPDLPIIHQRLSDCVNTDDLISRLQIAVREKDLSTVEMMWTQVVAAKVEVGSEVRREVETMLAWVETLETRIEQAGSDPTLIDMILQDCEAKKISSPLIPKLLAKKSSISAFQPEAALSLNLLSLPLMRQVLQSARELDLLSHPFVTEINRMLYEVNEMTFVRWQYDAAVKLNDKGLMLERLMALRDFQWRSNSAAYEWTRYPRLRTPEEWASKKWVGRESLAKGMLRHSKHLLPQSLSILRSTKLEKQSLDLFKSLLTITGDRVAHNDIVGEILDFLLTGLRNRELREELYLQIMKQLTGNEDGTSLRKAWDLLALCVRWFNHPALDCYLHAFVRTECQESESLLRVMYAAQVQPMEGEPTREWVAAHLKLKWVVSFPTVTYSPETHPSLTTYAPRVRDF